MTSAPEKRSVVAEAVIGAFPTAVLLRVWLNFFPLAFTFYPDRNYATQRKSRNLKSRRRLLSRSDSSVEVDFRDLLYGLERSIFAA